MNANQRALWALTALLALPGAAHADWLAYKKAMASRAAGNVSAEPVSAVPTGVTATAAASGTSWVRTSAAPLPESLDDLPSTAAGGRMSNTLSMAMVSNSPPASADVVESRLDKRSTAAVSTLVMADAPSRFDLSVNNAPAARVFAQLAAGTDYSIMVSPDVSGNISAKFKNATVLEALESLRDLYGYDFKVTGNRVVVYPNTVQTRMFRVNYLPGRRQGASDLHVTSSSITQSGSNGSSSSSSGQSQSSSNGSGTVRSADTSSVRMTSDADFWRDVKESLNAMLGSQEGRSVTLNPGAGVIVVRATPLEQRHVAEFLRAVQLTIERQVMLEAKIVEVQLTKSAQSGVNWSLFKGNMGIINTAPGLTITRGGTFTSSDATITSGSTVTTASTGSGFYGLAVAAGNFTALISFLETQGDVQVLSSPRIATLNNQKAVLKVGSDELFVTGVTSNTTTTSSGNTVASPTLTLQPFFSGISLDVTPQIDENGTVMLHVHPSVSVVSEKQKTIDLGSQGTFKLPLATSSINETDSIVRVHDGHIVAIGGLMTQGATADRNGVPGLSDVPLVGNLFRYRSSSEQKHELVILIRPTIIDQDDTGSNIHIPETPLISSAQ